MQNILDSIKGGNIYPFFQPIICNTTKEVTKYECLARLYHQEKYLEPFYFLELARENNLLDLVTKQMISKCFHYFKDKEKIHFSVNLSFTDLITDSSRWIIKKQIIKFPNPQNITFEFLEDSSIEFLFSQNKNSIKGQKCIEFIRSKGCLIALDDFGSGYSNFVNIEYLKVDIIKIDGSLIRGLSRPIPFQLITSISELASKNNIKTIAEFVETKEVYEQLKLLGVDYSQGYYFGKPKKDILEVDR